MMTDTNTSLAPNSLAFMALANEYCCAMENARQSEPAHFVISMLRLLPRLYITAADLQPLAVDDEPYLESVLDEDYYESVRLSVESLLGPDDTYLEVFEEDMKYSDTPIGASVAEGLTDIFQVLYNFVAMVKDAPDMLVAAALAAVKEEFAGYWSQKVCNVMRPLNHLRHSGALDCDCGCCHH